LKSLKERGRQVQSERGGGKENMIPEKNRTKWKLCLGGHRINAEIKKNFRYKGGKRESMVSSYWGKV